MNEYICKEVPTENGGYLEPEKELIRCKDCKYWRTDDGMFLDIDGYEWHKCGMLEIYKTKDGDSPACKAFSYCFLGKRKEENNDSD